VSGGGSSRGGDVISYLVIALFFVLNLVGLTDWSWWWWWIPVSILALMARFLWATFGPKRRKHGWRRV
jgi:hypothetical protein